MSAFYSTKQGDLLDEVCWQHYIFETILEASGYDNLASEFDPNLIEQTKYLLLQQGQSAPLGPIVDRVLAVNSELAEYPLVLPAGVIIEWPAIDQDVIDNVVSLCD